MELINRVPSHINLLKCELFFLSLAVTSVFMWLYSVTFSYKLVFLKWCLIVLMFIVNSFFNGYYLIFHLLVIEYPLAGHGTLNVKYGYQLVCTKCVLGADI